MNKNIKKILLFSIFIIILIGISGVNAQEVSNDTISSDLSDNVQVSTDTVYNTDLNSNINNNDNIEKITTKQKNIKTDDSSIDITNENYDQLGTYMNQYSTLNFVDDFDGKTIDITNGVTITSSPDYTFTNSHFIVNANGVTITNLKIENTITDETPVIYINKKSNVNITNNDITLTKTNTGRTYAIEANSTSYAKIDSNNITVNAYPQSKEWIELSLINYVGVGKVAGVVVDHSNHVNVTNNNITLTNSTVGGQATSTFESIAIRNDSTYVSARDNNIDTSNANYSYGITIERSDRCNATGNIINVTSECYVCGIELMEDKHTLLTYNNITGRAFRNANTSLIGESFAYGIYVGANYVIDMSVNTTVSYNNINLSSDISYGIEGYKITGFSYIFNTISNGIYYNNITVNGTVAMGMGFNQTTYTNINNNIIKATAYNRTLSYYVEAIPPTTTGIKVINSVMDIQYNHILVNEYNTVVDDIYSVLSDTLVTVKNNYLTSNYNDQQKTGDDSVYPTDTLGLTISNNHPYDLMETINNNIILTKNIKSSIKSSPKTIILTSENYNEYVSDRELNSNVNKGDTIDMQGLFDSSLKGLTINKPVNIISSTNDANISLDSGLNTRRTGNQFIVNIAGSGTNITGLNFYNTRVTIDGANDVSINNVTCTNYMEQIGQGVGAFSIRNSASNINVTNSNFSTHGNFGHSTLVVAGGHDVLIENNTIMGETDDGALGKIGNLFYITNYGAEGNNYNITVRGNTIDASKVLHDNEICNPVRILGSKITIENNVVISNDDAILEQWMESGQVLVDQLIVRNNTVTGRVALSSKNVLVTDNNLDSLVISNSTVVNNNIKSLIIGNNSTVKNNNISESISIGENTILEENNIDSSINITKSNILINNNTISTDDDYAIVLNDEITNITIANNNLKSLYGTGEGAIKTNSVEYTSENNGEYGHYVYITDDNFDDYVMSMGNTRIVQNLSNGDYVTINSTKVGTYAFLDTLDKNITIFGLNSDCIYYVYVLGNTTIRDSTIYYLDLVSMDGSNNFEGISVNVINSTVLGHMNGMEQYTPHFVYDENSRLLLNNPIMTSEKNKVYGLIGSTPFSSMSKMVYIRVFDEGFSMDGTDSTVLSGDRYQLYLDGYLEKPIIKVPTEIIGIKGAIYKETQFTNMSSGSNATNVVFNELVKVDKDASDIKFTDCTFNKGILMPKDNNITFENCVFVEDIQYLDYNIRVSTTEFTIGTNATISASICYGDDVVSTLNKGKVSFKVNGKTLKDASGKVIYAKVVNGVAVVENYLIPEGWNNNTIMQAIYTGSSDVSKLTSDKTPITIVSQETTIVTEDITVSAGSTVMLTATVNAGSVVVNNAKVVFKINGKSIKDANGKVIYAKVVNNQVSVEYVIPEDMNAGEYNITAVLLSPDYERLTDTKTLTVTN